VGPPHITTNSYLSPEEYDMTNNGSNGKPTIYPFLRYDDAPGAIEWLTRAFGFEQHFSVPNPDGTIAHAEMRFGSGMIMLGSAAGNVLGMKTPRELGSVNQGIYVYVADIDEHYQRARAAGAEITRDLEATDYGSREYTAHDFEGNLWSFGTYQP
jgi:uncharacterized glyoxalase superfamily protein PhnB